MAELRRRRRMATAKLNEADTKATTSAEATSDLQPSVV